ncbi:hypothetical protein SBOR_3227 [Sclerotinia borealis F-4128]|uniref:Uncharacterized protein n=1 Tax=Sclerotinia borealis (strain F-4128) TaxID=1432307 RepID=W9CPI8_SCLBF|nr:hypothetical protein SBOR_3227 [Sclerotinia borealis F-4128]
MFCFTKTNSSSEKKSKEEKPKKKPKDSEKSKPEGNSDGSKKPTDNSHHDVPCGNEENDAGDHWRGYPDHDAECYEEDC